MATLFHLDGHYESLPLIEGQTTGDEFLALLSESVGSTPPGAYVTYVLSNDAALVCNPKLNQPDAKSQPSESLVNEEVNALYGEALGKKVYGPVVVFEPDEMQFWEKTLGID